MNDVFCQVDHVLPKLRFFKWLCHQVWDSASVVPSLRIPCLFIASGRDELVPKDMMVELHRTYGGPDKVWKLFPEAQHMNANTHPGYSSAIKGFLDGH